MLAEGGQPLLNLLQVFLVKHALLAHGVLAVQYTGEDRIVVRHAPGQPLGGAWLDRFADVRQVEAQKTHLVLPRARGRAGWDGERVLAFLLEALIGRAALAKIQMGWTRTRRPAR